MALGNVIRAEEHFNGLGIRVVKGHRYLRGFIGDAEAERECLREKGTGVDGVGECTGRGLS